MTPQRASTSLLLCCALFLVDVPAIAWDGDSDLYGRGSSGGNSSYRQELENRRIMEQNQRQLEQWKREAEESNRRMMEQQRSYNDGVFGHTFQRGNQSVTCYPGPTSNQSTCF